MIMTAAAGNTFMRVEGGECGAETTQTDKDEGDRKDEGNLEVSSFFFSGQKMMCGRSKTHVESTKNWER